ncbi:MAG: metallophosphoesterase [Candidatus Nanohaloarchaea archaeon]
MTEFNIIDSKPAVYFPEKGLIAVSDLHLGLEGSMTSRGHYIPEFQLEELKEELNFLKKETDAERIVVNGDLKNQYSTSYTEKNEIEELLQHLKETFKDVIIVKGNHDTFIEDTVKDKGLRTVESYSEDGLLFVHGHEKVEEEFETLVIGHEHPALALTDEIGVTEKVPCLLHGNTERGEIIVLPAFSKISRGSEVNRMNKNELLSPILRDVGLKDFEAYAVSREGGVYDFGKVQNL